MLAGLPADAQATDEVSTPFPGVGITRVHRTVTSPRVINLNVLTFDLNDPRIEFFTTPGDPKYLGTGSYRLLWTTSFVTQWGLDGAINANYWGGGLGSEGDLRQVIGLVVSDGWLFSYPRMGQSNLWDPAMAFRADGSAYCGYISGVTTERLGVAGIGYENGQIGTLLVENGVNRGATARVSPTVADPRTVAGVSADGRTLILAAIDGRTGASQGMTLPEAANLLLEFGAYNGVNLDGGGSTTMVLRPPGGSPTLINLTTGSQRAVACHLGFRVLPPPELPKLVAAYAFGATSYTQAVPNDPTKTYTKLQQVSGSTTSIEYDAGRGYGYTDLTGLDTSPNNSAATFDGDPLYAENIGAVGAVGSIVFRANVPNGVYRFVAAGGNASQVNHATKLRVRNGGGTWINMLDHPHTTIGAIWRIGFGDKLPPPADGAGHDSGTRVDPDFKPIVNSPVITVTSGYLEFEQIGRGVAFVEEWGGDLSLLEIWQIVDTGDPTVQVVPTAIHFPNTERDAITANATIAVSNTGVGPLTYAAAIAGDDADAFEFSGASSASVPPGGDDPLYVRFAPSRKGAATARVEITSNDPASPLVIVDLSGYGLADPAPDFDEDGDVDLSDFSHFLSCYNGPNRPPANADCEDANLDGSAADIDVDVADFSLFQICFNGAGRPAAPICLD